MSIFSQIIVLVAERNVVNLIIKKLPDDMDFILSNNNTFGSHNNIMLKSSGEFKDVHEAKKILNKKFKKIRTYFLVNYPEIQVKHGPTINEPSEMHKPKIIDLSNLKDFFNSSHIEAEVWLDEAIEDYNNGKIIDSFTKLINWLDGIEGKPATIYCSIRDNLSHLSTDRAYNLTQKLFPNLFEFDGKIMKKNNKNIQALQSLFPDILKHIKITYNNNFM